MGRINWDYAFGLFMGVVVCKACDKLYKQGFNDGLKAGTKAFDLALDITNDVAEEKDEEES